MMEDYQSIYEIAYFNILKTGSWIEARIKEALKPFDLTHGQLNALYILMENDPHPVAANDLKSRMLVANPDLTRMLDRLVKKGIVVRETCPENRRKIDISLSDSGKILFEKAHSAAKQSLGNFFEGKITEDEARELRRILGKIRRNNNN